MVGYIEVRETRSAYKYVTTNWARPLGRTEDGKYRLLVKGKKVS